MALSRPFKQDRLALLLSMPLSPTPQNWVFKIFDMNALKMDLPPLKRAMALYQ